MDVGKRAVQALDVATGRWHSASLCDGVVKFEGWGNAHNKMAGEVPIREPVQKTAQRRRKFLDLLYSKHSEYSLLVY